MTRTHFIIAAALGSAALLLGAWGFQYIVGLYPCKMCIWQRYPHGIAAVIGLLAVAVPRAPLILLGALSAATTAAIGIYHAGVEWDFWQGPTTCTSGAIGALSTDQLLEQIMTAPLVRCDDIAWAFAGLSMAGWNAVLSLGLVALWLMALRRT